MPLAVDFIFSGVFDKLIQSFIENSRIFFRTLYCINSDPFVQFRKINEVLIDLIIFFSDGFQYLHQ